jgi:ketosteroid isomerase-like protein
MKKLFGLALVTVLALAGSQAALGNEFQTPADLDAFWSELSRTVAEGDFEGYAATYHEDAVLVSKLSGTSYPISQALDGWKQGFLDTEAGQLKASVEFRFTQRLSDETTAHETGIFHYSALNAAGEGADQFIHFEALLVNKGGWKMIMEYQKSRATLEEWEAAG